MSLRPAEVPADQVDLAAVRAAAGIAVTPPEGATPEELARGALVGRRELVLLEQPSVLAVGVLLASVCRSAAPWVRAAVGTLDRFAREQADGDLEALLVAGRSDPLHAQHSLTRLAHRHDGLTGGQLASLAFGPKLWWTAAGVPVPWRPLSTAGSTVPLPNKLTDPDVRLLLLAVIGSGATQAELLAVRTRDAGSLDAHGRVVPDLSAEPLAVRYAPADGTPERITFLSFEARAALHARYAEHGTPGPEEPLLLPPSVVAATSSAASATATALIAAGNDVNVTMCRATGDFFREWGMPGARFDPPGTVPETTQT